MRLDLKERRLTAKMSDLADGRDRLTLDYPPEMRPQVHKAFAELLAPPDPEEPKKRGRPRNAPERDEK